MSIETTWRVVEEILREYGDRPPANDSRLRAQLQGLAADPCGLSRLADRVRKRRDWANGSGFLRGAIEAALEAWEKRSARHHAEAARLAQAIAEATSPGDEAHRLSLRLLYRADRESFVRNVLRDLRSSGRGNLLETLQRAYGPIIPREDWLPVFHSLRNAARDPDLSLRLSQAIAKLESTPGEVGQNPAGLGRGAARGADPARLTPAEPPSAAGHGGAGHLPPRVAGSAVPIPSTPTPGQGQLTSPGPAAIAPGQEGRPRSSADEATEEADRSVRVPERTAPPPPSVATAPPPRDRADDSRLRSAPELEAESRPARGEAGPISAEKTEQATAGAKRPRSRKESKVEGRTKGPENATVDLESCLAEVNGMITRLFRRRDEEGAELLRRCARVQKDNERLEAKAVEQRGQVDDLAAQLDRVRRDADEATGRLRQAETRLADREEAARRAGERVEALERELREARDEIEAAERRARDDVHRANLQRDHAVQGFRFRIREQVLPFLSEANDDARAAEELTPEQGRLRLRLRQVLDALRDLGVDTD